MEYLVANSNAKNNSREPSFSFRQLVVFSCWRGLWTNAIEFSRHPKGTTVPPQYHSVFDENEEDDTTPRKRPPPLSSNASSKRGSQDTQFASGSGVKFAWQAGQSYQLTVIGRMEIEVSHIDIHSHHDRIRSPHNLPDDSGCEDTNLDEPPRSRQIPFERGVCFVEGCKTATVANLSHGGHHWIAKFFPQNTDSETQLDKEIIVYNRCVTLQGWEIPFAYGVYSITAIPGRVLLLESITPGTTIKALRQASMTSVRSLRESATNALSALHRYSISHLDLHANNVLVSGFNGREVVIIDFGHAMIDVEKKRQWKDISMLTGPGGVFDALTHIEVACHFNLTKRTNPQLTGFLNSASLSYALAIKPERPPIEIVCPALKWTAYLETAKKKAELYQSISGSQARTGHNIWQVVLGAHFVVQILPAGNHGDNPFSNLFINSRLSDIKSVSELQVPNPYIYIVNPFIGVKTYDDWRRPTDPGQFSRPICSALRSMPTMAPRAWLS